MGTTPPESKEPIGTIQRVGHTAHIVTEATSEIAYGRQSGSLYPLVLLLIAGIAILTTEPLVALIPLILLAVWVGGRK
jgi:hypothetical protein